MTPSPSDPILRRVIARIARQLPIPAVDGLHGQHSVSLPAADWPYLLEAVTKLDDWRCANELRSTGLTWRRFRDEKPKRDGMVAEQHLLTWNVRVATYDHGCITSDWQHGEEIDGHPDDLWCWLPTDPEPPALAGDRS